MTVIEHKEAKTHKQNNVLIVLSKLNEITLIQEFYGEVVYFEGSSANLPKLDNKSVYLCGDISQAENLDLKTAGRVQVVEVLSQSHGNEYELVKAGQVPIDVYGLGVLYREYFDDNLNYFKRISQEHEFQSLTESNKPGVAHRTGIYLTPVERKGKDLHFNLLRCSTNLSGPTENFCKTDREIVEALNDEAENIFCDHAKLNHVLAQVYRNRSASEGQKQAKARISSHADKTKDMPENGIMAFCTFYDELEKLNRLEDGFDYGYKETSGLTKLHFRLKNSAENSDLPEQFTLTLYPGSVFFMPLSTNRLYTHEIKSSMLNADMLPTRLGYVVRCSNTGAVHREGQTFLKVNDQLRALEEPTQAGMDELRKLYAEENRTTAYVDYANKFFFSMNKGDYTAPDCKGE